MNVISSSHGGVEELFDTAVPEDGEDPDELFEQVIGAVRATGACIVRRDVLGVPAAHEAGMEALARVCGRIDWPLKWLEGGAAVGTALSDTPLHVVSGVTVKRIARDGRVVASVFENEFGRFCGLSGIRGIVSRSPTEQACETFENMETLLDQA